MSVLDELGKLADLRDRGVLSEEEFGRQKARLLGDPTIPDGEDGDASEPSAGTDWKFYEQVSTGKRLKRSSIQRKADVVTFAVTAARTRGTDKIGMVVAILLGLLVFVLASLWQAGVGTGGL